MGKAVFFGGELYVLGGETQNGGGATSRNVYSRVDIYNPTTNTWRLGTPMLTARHGIFPVLTGNRITVAGGGVQAGFSALASSLRMRSSWGSVVNGQAARCRRVATVDPASASRQSGS